MAVFDTKYRNYVDFEFGFSTIRKRWEKVFHTFPQRFWRISELCRSQKWLSKNIFSMQNHRSNFSFQKSFFHFPATKKHFTRRRKKTQKKNKPKYRILKTDFFEKEKKHFPSPSDAWQHLCRAGAQKKAIDGKTTKTAIKSPRKMPRAPYTKKSPRHDSSENNPR